MGTARTRDKGDLIMPDLDHGTQAETDTARARDRATPGDFPDTSVPPPNDAPAGDIHDLPRNEQPRYGGVAGPAPDPRAGETASQDVAPTEEDIQLEATLLRRRAGEPGVDEWMSAQRRVQPGLDDGRADTVKRRRDDV